MVTYCSYVIEGVSMKKRLLFHSLPPGARRLRRGQNDPVPLWLRNAPTRLMKDLGAGEQYKYAHDYYKAMPLEDPERPPAEQLQAYLPESLRGRRYYEPGHQGQEAGVKRWLEKRRGASQPT
jgi:putative ATPase